MENLLSVILSMGDLDMAIHALKNCEKENNHSLGLFLSKSFQNLFPNSLDINLFHVKFLFSLKRMETCFDFIEKTLQFPNIPPETLKYLLDTQASCSSHLENRSFGSPNALGLWPTGYTAYNEELCNKLYTKEHGQITFTITTCKRLDLFKRTMNSFLACCTDVEKIDKWFCVDDNSSEEDRKEMQLLYPFFEFYFKTPEEKGHANSMNIILKNLTTPYVFHMEDDWQFFARKPYISLCLEVLHQNKQIGQCLVNKNYAETSNDNIIVGGIQNQTVSGLRYIIHEHNTNQEDFNQKYGLGVPSCAYWPHYSLRPSLLKSSILKNIGLYNPESSHFEMEYAHRYRDQGYLSAFLEGIYSRHIGRLTSERDSGKENAYVLNNESQFVKKEPMQTAETLASQPGSFTPKKSAIPIFVINLDRRPDRLKSFREKNPTLLYERFAAVDGMQVKNSLQLQRIFDGNDYNMKRGMVGCALSHMKLWIELLELKDETFCVLEDDAVLCDNFTEKISKIPNNFDICFLGHHMWKHNEADENLSAVDPTSTKHSAKEALDLSMGGTAGYLITKDGARKMLEFISKVGMRNCIDTMMQKAGDSLNLYYVSPRLVTSPCPSIGPVGSVDSDIQYNESSLTLSTDDKHKQELEYLLTLANIGRCPSREVIDQLLRAGAIKEILFYVSENTTEVPELARNCSYPYYTIDDRIMYVIPKFSEKIIDDRWVLRVQRKGIFTLEGIEVEKPVTPVTPVQTTSSVAVIPFGDCSHTFEAIKSINPSQPMLPFDVLEGANFKTCSLLTELCLDLDDADLESFVKNLCDEKKHSVRYQGWNKKNILENKTFNFSFPHEDVSTLIPLYIEKFRNLKNAIQKSSTIKIVNCSRWKNVNKSEYYHLYDLLKKHNKNVKIMTVNGLSKNEEIEGERNISVFEVDYPAKFTTANWNQEHITFDQNIFRLSIVPPIRNFIT